MQNETLETKIRTRLSEMDYALKELNKYDPDTLSQESFENIGELEYCIVEFKMLLGIDLGIDAGKEQSQDGNKLNR
jgi:hypothetical protein